MRIGIELELLTDPKMRLDNYKTHTKRYSSGFINYDNRNYDRFILPKSIGFTLKSDSSLGQYGVEVVTEPFVLNNRNLDRLKTLVHFLKNGEEHPLGTIPKLKSGYMCGMHIHSEFLFFGTARITRQEIRNYALYPTAQKFLEEARKHYRPISDRQHYTRFENDFFNHYNWIHITDFDTLEFRIFNSTTNFRQIVRCISFVERFMGELNVKLNELKGVTC